MRNNHFRDNFRVTVLVSIFSLIGLSCSCFASFAQTAIAPDTKLPVNTLVNFNNTSKTYTITGGTQVGTTQFHSFQDFSVPTGNTAHFDSVLPTTNVIGRVTGSNISNIDGTLKTNGSTNLYLINPNGIVFGADAKLDIAGSFSASTANSIKFSDGSEFSATNPQAPPLLQVSIPLGLQYGESKKGATIKSSGSLVAGQDLVLNANKLDLDGLTLGKPDFKPSEILQAGKDLKLEAKDSIKIENGFLRTDKTSVGNAGNITINAGSLYLNNSSITANTFAKGNAGTINITVTDSIKFDGKSSVQSQIGSATVIGNAGAVNVSAKTLELLGGSSLASNTYGQGNAGNITINISNSIKFDGKSFANSQVASQTAIGNAGNVNITAKALELLGGSFLASNTYGQGNAGNISININDSIKFDGASSAQSQVAAKAIGNAGNVNITAKTLELLGGSFLANNTFAQGDAGKVTLNVVGSIKFDDKSSAQSQVGKTGEGNAGNVNVSAKTLELLGGSFLAANTLGKGNAGSVDINITDSIKFDGGSFANSQVLAGAEGNAGNVNIDTNTLELRGNSFLASSTFGRGNAGNITIDAKNKIEASGTNSIVRSTVQMGAVGDAGIVSINTESLVFTNGAKISTSTSGTGKAGDITITANYIKFDNASSAKSQVENEAVGNAGNVNIVANTLNLLGGSFLANNNLGKGNAGNITITVDTLELLGESYFASNTFGQGDAGNITITVADSIKFDGKSVVQSQVEDNAVGNAGRIVVFAKTLELLGGSSLATNTSGKGDAGTVDINVSDSIKFDGKSVVQSQVEDNAVGNAGRIVVFAKTLELLGGSSLATNTSGKGDAGTVDINVSDSIKFDGGSYAASQVNEEAVGNAAVLNVFAKTLQLLGNSSLFTSTFGKGNAGNITIDVADSIKFDGVSYASSQVRERAVGDAGFVNVSAKVLELLDISFLSTSTFGKGNAGNITIDVADSIKFSGGGFAISQVKEGAVGNAGILNVFAKTLELLGDSSLTTSTFGKGNAGNIIITAKDNIEFSGLSNTNSDNLSGVFSSVETGGNGNAGTISITANSLSIKDGAQITVKTEGQGNAGNVNIKAETLNIRNAGSISTSTATDGKAGNINIILGEALFLDGNGSLITAGTTETSTGQGGSILIDPPLVSITNGAVISVDSLGKGNGGSLKIVAGKFIFANNAILKANTASGEGGNIDLKITDILFPRNSSNITATAGGTGNGGNISLSSLFMISVPSENSDLFANAFFGKGGQIDITTNGLFGLEFRSRQTPFSDITASSEFGIQGTVSITTPGVDPSKGLSNLPVDTSDASKLVAEKCLADRQGSSFVITGRGGVPASPFDTISAVNIPDHLGSISNQTANNTSNLVTSRSANPSDRLPHNIPDRIVEAQGWIINSQGQISLIAEVAAMPAPVWSNQPKCVSISNKQLAIH